MIALRSTIAATLLGLANLFALPATADIPIKEVTSPGGIKAWLVEDHNIPFTALEVRFRGGTSLDAAGARGATYLMAALVEEGAGDLDSKAFAEARDDLAATMSFRASTDTFSVSTRFLTENRDQAVDLLALALNHPRFDQDAVDRVREQVLASLRSKEKDPGAIAARAFDSMSFGNHPYATSGEGTIASVSALTRDDIIAAHKGALARDRIYVSAAGDISAEDLGLILDRLFGALPETGAAQPADAPWELTGGTTVIDFPSPQSVVLFGHRGIRMEDPDFFPAFVLNEVIGGGRFSARLMREVREKRGLTYGIGTYMATMDHSETYIGQFSASNDKVAEAVQVIRDEWQKIATEGISEAELTATKTYLTGSYPLRFDGNGTIASVLVGMQMQGFPIDYPNTRNEKVEAVTLADVKRAAARLLRPEELRFIAVGQPVGLETTAE